MWDNLSKREKGLLAFLLIIMIIAPYYFFIYQPDNQLIEDCQQQISDKERELALTRAYVKKLPEAKRQLTELLKTESIIMESDFSNEGILNYLNTATKKNNVKLVAYNPVVKDNEITVNVLLEGEFDDLIYFMKDFENTYRGFKYNNLDMKPQSGLIQLRINFTYKDKEQSGGGIS